MLLMVIFVMGIFMVLGGKREQIGNVMWTVVDEFGVQVAGAIMKGWIPWSEETENRLSEKVGKTTLISYLEELAGRDEYSEDPAYERMLAVEWEKRQSEEGTGGDGMSGSGKQTGGNDESVGSATEISDDAGAAAPTTSESTTAATFTAEAIATKPSGSVLIREKLADYDYLMSNFYIVHPTTTAGRDLMSAEKFLTMDLKIEKDQENPQILIYHTHSQEEFADYPENKDATIIGVGTYLTELLESRGYQVIHDTTVYDYKNGKLDRSQAYTYALEGITGILQKYPSIEVVLDIHRDGVAEGTKLVTEVNGKPTAQIMFFNGTSQTPDGPIEYLPNPNRDANMAFSFQMQLKATEQYPGYTRKIYLKGLRYNQHVRARTALIEVGAQTNTYAEALNAMEPLADILCQVLNGD